jgi:DNA-binding NarL/FixJ family response regulator
MKELSLGAQLDRAVRQFEMAKQELSRVQKLVLTEMNLLRGMRLTYRQRQVLDGIRRGLQNKEIGASLGCTARTVKFHVAEILRETGCSNRYELLQRLINEDETVPTGVIPIRSAGARAAQC